MPYQDRQTDASWVIYHHLQALFAPKDRRPIYQWAADHVQCPQVLTIHGKFNPDISRHFIGIFDALADDYVRTVVLRKPTRGGGTLISDIWHAWTRVNDPGPAMVVMQTDKLADEHAETRFMPVMFSVAEIRALLPSNRNQIRTSEIIYADGIPVYLTGPAIGGLQSKGIRYMTCDEPWLYKPGILAEAEGRLGDFLKNQTSKFFLVSQAGLEDDDFDRHFESGHKAVWNVPCLGCGSYFPPKWTGHRGDGSIWGMRWDEHKDERGIWLVNKCLESIRYECPLCGYVHLDNAKTKGAWNERGKYEVTAPNADRSKRSFHYNAIIDYPWIKLVGDFLDGLNAYKMGVIEPLIVFFQKRMAEPKSEKTLNEATLTLKRTAYDITSQWPEESFRCMTIDRQEEEVFWWMIRMWSKTGESRRIAFGMAYGFSELVEIQNKYNVLNVFIDSGFKPKGDNGVYAACIKHGWTSLKGDKRAVFWHSTKRGRIQRSYSELLRGDPESGRFKEGKKQANLIMFSSDTYQDRLHQLITRRLWVEPAHEDKEEAEYRRQMGSTYRRKKVDDFTGAVTWVWVCPSGNDHLRDCAKMQIVGATLADILPDIDSEPAQLAITTPAKTEPLP